MVGVDDDLLGQAVIAHVSAAEGYELDPDALRRHCAAHLEDFMIPKRVADPRLASEDRQRQAGQAGAGGSDHRGAAGRRPLTAAQPAPPVDEPRWEPGCSSGTNISCPVAPSKSTMRQFPLSAQLHLPGVPALSYPDGRKPALDVDRRDARCAVARGCLDDLVAAGRERREPELCPVRRPPGGSTPWPFPLTDS